MAAVLDHAHPGLRFISRTACQLHHFQVPVVSLTQRYVVLLSHEVRLSEALKLLIGRAAQNRLYRFLEPVVHEAVIEALVKLKSAIDNELGWRYGCSSGIAPLDKLVALQHSYPVLLRHQVEKLYRASILVWARGPTDDKNSLCDDDHSVVEPGLLQVGQGGPLVLSSVELCRSLCRSLGIVTPGQENVPLIVYCDFERLQRLLKRLQLRHRLLLAV